MFFPNVRLLSALLISTLIGLGAGVPADLEDRQTACIGFGACPEGVLPVLYVTTPPQTTPAPLATFGCFHAADPDGAQGYCPAVAATGWCVCSDSSTYGIETGPNPCGYTTPPASGPTALASTHCATSTSYGPSATYSPSGRTKCSQAECPKFCAVGNSTAKRSTEKEDSHLRLDRRFYENADRDQFPYRLLEQRYTTNICPKAYGNTFFWKRLERQRLNYAAALKGLCGCTTIIVASAKGVFSSHIWESDETENPPRDLQEENYEATLQDLETELSVHKNDLAGGEAFLIIPTDPDRVANPDNPHNYLYGATIVDAINDTVIRASGALVSTIALYDPLDFELSPELTTNRRGTASFEFDPAYVDDGQTSRAYRVISEGKVLALRTDL